MELSADAIASYTSIIDSILANSDLTTISEKRIRRGLQDATGHDLLPHKAAIKELIMQRFDIVAARYNIGDTSGQPEPQPAANGHAPSNDNEPDLVAEGATSISPEPTSSSTPPKRSADPETIADATESAPPKKKRKDETVDSDAVYAARLQAEENSRVRSTRGANTRKAAPAKKKKTKTSKKVKASDDSDLEGSGGENKKEVNRTGGFHKPLNLSAPLSILLGGEITLSRPQAVKKVWEYIRQHDLQDPTDRRHIRCDDLMRPVFKQDRIHMFTMTKILNQNLYNPDE